MVVPISNQIRLVGHTDDRAPSDPRYPTNWELSFARAKYVADILINAGVDPKRIIVSGRGEYDPVFPNDSDTHRSLNGRVDIIIIYEIDNKIMETIK